MLKNGIRCNHDQFVNHFVDLDLELLNGNSAQY
jgi:hypothetical protein